MADVINFSEIAKAKILIVDDVPVLRMLIQTCLKKAGYTNLYQAENGDQALEILHEIKPDLMILDIVMPGTDGFEVCRQIRQDERYAEMPILIQTGMEANQERAQVFEVGANDLISKPINVYELVARVKLQLQNQHLQRKERAYQARMESELRAARTVQESLLPDPDCVQKVQDGLNVTIQHHWQASSELGGDLWGVNPLGDHYLGFYIVDFSGHGVASALNTFRLHTLINGREMNWMDPKACVAEVNNHLAQVLSAEQFATLFWGVIDLEKDTLTYSAAAAPPVLVGLNQQDESSIHFLDTSGLPVGVLDGYQYDNVEIPFPKGSFIFLYSDALIESPDHEDKMWTEEGLMDRVRQYAAQGYDQIQPRVLAEFLETAQRPIPDDLTTISIIRHQ